MYKKYLLTKDKIIMNANTLAHEDKNLQKKLELQK